MWSIPPIPFPTASPWATSGRRRGRAGAWGAGGAGRGAGVRGGRPAQGPGAPRPKPEAEVCVVCGRTRCPVLRFAASPEPLYANSTWRSPRQTSDALARLRTDRWTIRTLNPGSPCRAGASGHAIRQHFHAPRPGVSEWQECRPYLPCDHLIVVAAFGRSAFPRASAWPITSPRLDSPPDAGVRSILWGCVVSTGSS